MGKQSRPANTKQININIQEDLMEHLKVYCAKNRKSVSQLILEMIEDKVLPEYRNIVKSDKTDIDIIKAKLAREKEQVEFDFTDPEWRKANGLPVLESLFNVKE